MSEMPSSCVFRGCDEPWFGYEVGACANAPDEQPTLGDIVGTVPLTNGVAWTGTVAVTGSTLTWVFSVVSGALPTGLVLSVVDDQTASITGTPTTPGTYSFTLLATNGWGISGSRAYALTVV